MAIFGVFLAVLRVFSFPCGVIYGKLIITTRPLKPFQALYYNLSISLSFTGLTMVSRRSCAGLARKSATVASVAYVDKND